LTWSNGLYNGRGKGGALVKKRKERKKKGAHDKEMLL
jgi:hypothetical protein